MKAYFSLIKFSHTIFALPFAIIGFILGILHYKVENPWRLFVLVILCMIFARSAAMAFNRLVDREIDARNPRTQNREIPAGVLTAQSVSVFVGFNCLAFIICTFFINPLCFYLSPVALLLILGYSYTKRFTWLCHFILGLGLSLAPIGAYLAISASFDLIPILFSLVVFTWVTGFDILYAMQDKDSDADQALFSIPSRLGAQRAFLVSSILHIATAVLLIIACYLTISESELSILIWIGVGLFLVLLVYQHMIISPTDISRMKSSIFYVKWACKYDFNGLVL